ncbi:MAG TPA: HEAT repeat domain-containing protein [Terriglobia bacterium]|nr:HEAT repeat domain-containing protein [Terriglobia bacterium]
MKNETRFLVLVTLTAGLSVRAAGQQARPADRGPTASIARISPAFENTVAPAPAVFAPAEPSSAAGGADPEDQAETLYRDGTQALDDHQWQTAIDKFNQLAALRGNHGDEALYWKAYAQNKQGRRADALGTIKDLEKSHPQSRWLKDARALELEVRQASGQAMAPQDQPNDELKLLAINALMNSDPDRALPLLEKLLQSDQPIKFKERALFVLSQSSSPKAREAVAQIARGNSDPALQKKALDSLALFGGDQSRQLLAQIYASSSDLAVKHEILHDFMISGDKDRLLAAAKTEKVAELRVDAIHQLGLVGGQDQLWQLYQQETAASVKKEILHAMFLGGNHQKLFELARTDADPEMRREAIHNLGLLGAQDELGQLYQHESSLDLKKEILHSMFLGGNGQRLIEVVRTETNPELRLEAIHSLGLLGGKQTGEVLASLYAGNWDSATRKAVLDALFIQGNAHALVEIARKENDPEMKKAIVGKLSLMNSKEATDYMLEILNH